MKWVAIYITIGSLWMSIATRSFVSGHAVAGIFQTAAGFGYVWLSAREFWRNDR